MKEQKKVKYLEFYDRFLSLVFTEASPTVMYCPSAQHCSVTDSWISWQCLRSMILNVSHNPPESMPALFWLFPWHSGNTFFIVLTSLFGYMHDQDNTKKKKRLIPSNSGLHIVRQKILTRWKQRAMLHLQEPCLQDLFSCSSTTLHIVQLKKV